MQGIVTRPAVGLNEYTPPTALNDNYMSDMLDCEPYKEEAIKMYSKLASELSGNFTNNVSNAGNIRAYISDHPVGDDPSILLLVKEGTDLYVKRLDMDDYGIGEFLVSASESLYQSDYYDSCLFKTEAKNYVCFIASARKELIWFDYSTTGLVTLPFYPKKIISHASRVFALDTGNKVWWCRAGDFFSWYSLAYDDDALMASTDMANAAYSLTAQPARAGVITATVTATSTADTMGSLAVVGTYNGVSQSEALAPVAGQRVQTVKTYDAITSITGSGWSAVAGTDKISFGVGPAGGYVQDDAGYWTVEKERDLLDFDVMSNVLYIFSASRIYSFSGYSPDTFTLQLAITDIGLVKEGNTISDLISANNRLYFISGADVYEFDGQNLPRTISRPVLVNNALTNGVMGGIELPMSNSLTFTKADAGVLVNANHWKIVADKTNLYIYMPTMAYIDLYKHTIYRFNFKSRTWWRKSGMSNDHPDISTIFVVMYLPTFTHESIYTLINNHVDDTISDVTIDEYDDMGFSNIYPRNDVQYPYLITKAYNTNPSELGTLTTLILMLSGANTEKANISVMYSLTTEADDFVEIWNDKDHLFTGDIEIVEIPVPVAYIANAHHYRLKIISEGDALYLYNIERRFRVRGRSR